MSLQVCAAGSSSVPCPSRLTPTSLITTLAPSRAMQSANSRPMPRPEPVTTATRPSRIPIWLLSSSRCVRVERTGRRPRWPSRSASPRRPGSSPTARAPRARRRRPARAPVTRAVNVSVSPGQTCLANRTLNLRIASGPSQSFTTRAMSPAVSIPCPNTDGLPDLGGDRVVVVHRVEVAARAGVADEVGAAEVLDDERRRRRRRRRGRRTGGRPGCWWSGSRASPRGRRSARAARPRLSEAARKVTRVSTPRSLPGCRAAARPLRRRGRPAGRELRARGQQTRQRLLDAGVEVFADAGLPRGPGRRHRQGRQDLARHLLPVLLEQGRPVPGAGRGRRRRDARARRRASRRSRPTATGYVALRAWLASFADLYEHYGPVIRAWTEAEIGGERVRPARHRRARRVHPGARSTGSGSAAPADLDPVVASLALVAMIERCNYYVLSRQVQIDREAMIDTLATVTHAALFGAAGPGQRAAGLDVGDALSAELGSSHCERSPSSSVGPWNATVPLVSTATSSAICSACPTYCSTMQQRGAGVAHRGEVPVHLVDDDRREPERQLVGDRAAAAGARAPGRARACAAHRPRACRRPACAAHRAAGTARRRASSASATPRRPNSRRNARTRFSSTRERREHRPTLGRVRRSRAGRSGTARSLLIVDALEAAPRRSVGRTMPEHDPGDRRLARAVRAEQREHLALGDRERHAEERAERSVAGARRRAARAAARRSRPAARRGHTSSPR